MAGNKVHDSPAKKTKQLPRPRCGAEKRQGSGTCTQLAGWGTDHVGSGRCKLHGGKSTGPQSPDGKERVSVNAIKHGGYIDKILDPMERDIYDMLFDQTIKGYQLDQENVMHMATLHRACMSYLKTLRLDGWEMEEEFIPHTMNIKNPKYDDRFPEGPGNKRYVDILDPQPIYNERGDIIGQEIGEKRRIRWAKNAPNWDSHFQKYISMLGTDRSSELKAKQDNKIQSKVVDALNWLWGGKSQKGDESNG